MLNTVDGKLVTHENYTLDEWLALIDAVADERLKLYPPLTGALVFDIGAHCGKFTRIMLRGGAGKVIAVEPLLAAAPQIVNELLWLYGINPIVILVAAAIDGGAPYAEFFINRFQPYLSTIDKLWMTKSVHSEYFNDGSTIKSVAPTTTIDWLIATYGIPVFIKIDAEGHDGEVIKTLSTPVDHLCWEYHQDWLVDSHVATLHLESLASYEFNYTRNDESVFILDEWLGGDSLIRHLSHTLEPRGPKSWGDIYARRKQ